MNNDSSRMWMGVAGCALVFGFFMPWIDIAGFGGLSGWELVKEGGLSTSTRLILSLCPILGVALAGTRIHPVPPSCGAVDTAPTNV